MEIIREIPLDELKQIELEMLVSFVNICRSHNLKYYLAYGTLLGAVRHKGFIPWDDDIDVWMPRKDYDILNKLLLNKIIDGKYVLKNLESDNYIYAFAKFMNINTHVVEKWMLSNILGVYMDIFPLDNIPNEIKLRKAYLKELMFYHYGLLLTSRVNKSRKKLWVTIASKILYYPMRLTGYKRWLRWVDTISRRYNSLSTGYLGNVSIDNYISKEYYPEQWFEPCSFLEFEKHIFNVPGNYDAVLRSIYDDYMILPPVEKRVKKHENKAYWIKN